MKRKKKEQSWFDLRIQLDMEAEQERLFGFREKKRFSLGKERRNVMLCGIAMVVVFFLCLFIFRGNLLDPLFSLAVWVQNVKTGFQSMATLLSGGLSGAKFQLCIYSATMLTGVALAVSGVCFQAVFRNPMANPTMLGVESGGVLGSIVYLMFFYSPSIAMFLHGDYEMYAAEWNALTFWQRYSEYFLVCAGCIAVVVIVLILAKISGRGRIETVTLMVGGTVFSACITSVITVVEYCAMLFGGNRMLVAASQSLLSGSFEYIRETELAVSFAVLVLIPFVILLFLSKRMNIIAFGEEEARMMGMRVGCMRVVIVLLSTMMTAAVVAFCGVIGFVGLIVPHMARYIVGSDFRHLVPASAFLGGIYMMLAVSLATMFGAIFNPGIVANVVGGIVFLFIMIRYRRRNNADWA